MSISLTTIRLLRSVVFPLFASPQCGLDPGLPHTGSSTARHRMLRSFEKSSGERRNQHTRGLSIRVHCCQKRDGTNSLAIKKEMRERNGTGSRELKIRIAAQPQRPLSSGAPDKARKDPYRPPDVSWGKPARANIRRPIGAEGQAMGDCDEWRSDVCSGEAGRRIACAEVCVGVATTGEVNQLVDVRHAKRAGYTLAIDRGRDAMQSGIGISRGTAEASQRSVCSRHGPQDSEKEHGKRRTASTTRYVFLTRLYSDPQLGSWTSKAELTWYWAERGRVRVARVRGDRGQDEESAAAQQRSPGRMSERSSCDNEQAARRHEQEWGLPRTENWGEGRRDGGEATVGTATQGRVSVGSVARSSQSACERVPRNRACVAFLRNQEFCMDSSSRLMGLGRTAHGAGERTASRAAWGRVYAAADRREGQCCLTGARLWAAEDNWCLHKGISFWAMTGPRL
ncbi:hypothetical protein C8R44DRAFT_739487 [Mycena epipterygia]|nr:hypothetical protein C8R44DRAFT_739487 [Mycena epipterygia]